MSFLVRILLLLCVAISATAEERPIVVGVALSQSGALSELADGYHKALVLWQEEVNARGGLLGRPVQLEVRDDQSDAVRVGRLYQALIREAQADLLIGPYGSAATLMAAAEAERARRVLVNGAGWSRAVQDPGSRYVFQTAMPYAAYGEGVLELARSDGLKRVVILARDDPASREMGEATRDAAVAFGMEPAALIAHSGGGGFLEQARAAQAAGAQAWIAFGGPGDAAEMIRALEKTSFAPPLFFHSSSLDPQFIRLVGQNAELSLGALPYSPQLDTPGNAQFVVAYQARWKTPPDLAAAEAYAAASVLAEAVRRTGALDPEKLRATLAALEMPTVLGGYKVDPKSGTQVAAKPAVAQIVLGKPQVVWPASLRTAERETFPSWSTRRLIE